MLTKKTLNGIPTVREAMTPFPWYVCSGDSLTQARAMLVKHDVRHLPVLEGEELVGVITDRDIHLIESVFTDVKERHALTVRDVSVADTYVVDVSEALDHVLMEMADRHIGSVLVVREKRLAGIFTVTDACRRFGEFLRATFPPGDDNRAA